jgi:DNA polymerase III alpha subunit
MKIDEYSRQVLSEDDLCHIFLSDPDHKLKRVIVDHAISLPKELELLSTLTFEVHTSLDIDVLKFDEINQNTWFLPQEYLNFDIAKYVLELCKTPEELQRVGEELIQFQERDTFPLLCYCKYLVDVMREHNIVWGVGRGSSVSSYVLYLIGIHKIDSLYYDLPIEEFLK